MLAAASVVVACAPGDRGADSTSAVDSAGAAPAPTTTTTPPASDAWVVSPRGIGRAVVGMPGAEVAALLGVPMPALGPDEKCTYLRGGTAPAGVLVMINDGTLARIDIDSGGVATAEGARIGDSEAQIQSIYPGRVTVQPHKYTAGHYLVVGPAAGSDTTLRILFETDSVRVTSYRAGRMPEVTWVEGCS